MTDCKCDKYKSGLMEDIEDLITRVEKLEAEQNNYRVDLKFKLPEQRYDYQSAIHGSDYRHMLQNLDNYLRAAYKHNDNDAIVNFAEACRQIIREDEAPIWGE